MNIGRVPKSPLKPNQGLSGPPALALRDEFLQLRDSVEQPDRDHMKQFVSDMLELVEAARQEGNPIVFV